jgi:hypothetical protein
MPKDTATVLSRGLKKLYGPPLGFSVIGQIAPLSVFPDGHRSISVARSSLTACGCA